MSLTRPLIYRRTLCVLLVLVGLPRLAAAGGPIGAAANIGCKQSPRETDRLVITQPGTYENYLVDSRWEGGNRVKIMADDVVLRNCEIRNATGNGIGVFSSNVLIENCKLHHLLKGTYHEQDDAHGITGCPKHLVIRNCEIAYVSGDSVQFDPARGQWDDVLIESCTFWTGPLEADAGGFKRGERPGENAFDSKTPPSGPRPKITIRNCLFHGWNQPGQIDMLAALNIKENVDAVVEHCLFRDNQVCFRLRGPGPRGGALVTVKQCAIYDSDVGVRMEDHLEGLTIDRLGFGSGVARKYHQPGGAPWPGYRNTGEYTAEDFENVLRRGFD